MSLSSSLIKTLCDADMGNRLVVIGGKGCSGSPGFTDASCPGVYTGNYIQYPVINHNGKEYEKEDTESLCYK